MELRKVSDDGTKIVLEHDPVPEAIGFRLAPRVVGGVKQSGYAVTWDGDRTRHSFASGHPPYSVEALMPGAKGIYPTDEPEPEPGALWAADLETGDFSQFTYPFDGGSHNPQNNGAGKVEVSNAHSRSGIYSIKHTCNAEGDNTRVFEMPRRASDGQWSWPDEPLVFSAWYNIPTPIHVGGNWNVFQFKSKELGGQGRNEPFFSFNLFDTANGYRLRVYHKPDGTGTGAYWLAEQGSQRVQVDQWFQIRARLEQSPLGAKRGRVTVWFNDKLTHDVGGLDTRYAGTSTQTWSVNNYGTGLTRPCVIYTDDHEVRAG